MSEPHVAPQPLPLQQPVHYGPAWHAVCSVPWAIEPRWLTTILAVTSRQNLSVEAVEAQLGRPLDGTRTVTVRDGVATIPLEGPIFRRAGLFAAISGGASVEDLGLDLTAALNEAAVSAILLNVDSPGGEVNGIAELAAMIRAAEAQKPVVAYISDLGASAAYWLASAAQEVVVASTALVGSIGVIATMPDPRRRGDGEIQFVSSQSPRKAPDPTTESGADQLQAMVDALAAEFVSDVARYRGVSVDKVLSDFGAGDVLVGQAAVAAGLADRVGSYEGVHAQLAERNARSGPAVLRRSGGRQAALLTPLTPVPGLQLAASQESLPRPIPFPGTVIPIVNGGARLAGEVLATPLLDVPLPPVVELRTMDGQAVHAPPESIPGAERAPREEPEAMDELEQAIRAACADAGILVTDGELSAAVQALGARATQAGTLEAEVGRLTPLADLGRQYHADLLAETLAEGVRAMGAAFPQETYQALLATASLDQLKALKADWAARADAQFPAGRVTADTEQTPAPAPRAAVPDAAFRA